MRKGANLLPNLIQIIKQAALEAVESSNPTKVLFGSVVKVSPDLEIKVEQKFTITKEFIVLSKRAKDTGLAISDKVILLQAQGGQKFIVLDKVGG